MINYLTHFIPEYLSKKELTRIPEPMLMLDELQVDEYLLNATKSAAMQASYFYNATAASRTLNQCRTVLDLGCGPATQLVWVAELNPQIQFVGADLSQKMLARAEKLINEKNLKNITLIEEDFSELKKIKDHSFDGVMSTLALHHLPTRDHLENTFKNISRVIGPKGALFLTDFCLFKRNQTINFVIELNKDQPPILKEDYLASLRAAFSFKDINKLKNTYFPESNLHKTFMVDLMFILKTKDTNEALDKNTVRKMYENFNNEDLKFLKDIYHFFSFGGYRNQTVESLL